MAEIDEIRGNLEMVIANLKIENAKLKSRLRNNNVSSLLPLCMDCITECVLIFDENGCEYANEVFTSKFNYSDSSDIDISIESLFSRETVRSNVLKLIESKENSSLSAYVSANDITLYGEVNIRFITDVESEKTILTIKDMSVWKAREARLKLEHNEMEVIFNTSMVGIMLVDDNRILRRMNKTGQKILGVAENEDYAGIATAVFHVDEEHRSMFGRYYTDVIMNGKVLDMEYPFKRLSDGSIIWIHLIGKAIEDYDNPGEYLGTIWTFEDVSERRRIQRKQEIANIELNAYFENSIVGMLVVSRDDSERLIITRANKKMLNMAGVDSKDDLIGKSLDMIYYSKEDYSEFVEDLVAETNRAKISYFEKEFINSEGKVIWVSGSAQLLDDISAAGFGKSTLVMIDDTTERKEDREKLEKVNAELETYFSNSMVGIVISDESYTFNRTNKRMADILGYSSPAELRGVALWDCYSEGGECSEVKERFDSLLLNHEVFKDEICFRRQDNQEIWVCVSGKAIDKNTPADLDKGVVWVIEDVTKRKIAEEKLLKLACIDELTEVNNRRSFIELAEKECSKAQRNKTNTAIFMIDLDYFKSVNDTYGHAVGDKTLRYFAEICKLSLRPADVLGRIGGEEFAVLLPDISYNAAYNVAQRLRCSVEDKFMNAPDSIPEMTVSIGVCCVRGDEKLGEAMKRADAALYQAKNNGRNTVVRV